MTDLEFLGYVTIIVACACGIGYLVNTWMDTFHIED